MIRRIQQFTTQPIPVATIDGLEPKRETPRLHGARPGAPRRPHGQPFGGKPFGGKHDVCCHHGCHEQGREQGYPIRFSFPEEVYGDGPENNRG